MIYPSTNTQHHNADNKVSTTRWEKEFPYDKWGGRV